MGFKDEITEKELSELAKPCLRLFMSVDVVGSTAFKQERNRSDPQGWLEFFSSFYTEFPELLNTALLFILRQKKIKAAPPEALLWKALGDELIFVVEISHRSEAEVHLLAFREAVRKTVTSFIHKEGFLSVNFKATAWLAGFPVGNAAVPLDDQKGGIPYDFIGPLIDIGFRLANLATPRRFVVSVELAYLILNCKDSVIDFYFEGKTQLKGVIQNRSYPFIWMDNYKGAEGADRHPEHELTEKEDGLTGKAPSNSPTLKDFCLAYIKEIGAPLMIPFIATDPADGLEKSKEYDIEREVIENRLRKVFIVREDIEITSTESSQDAVDTEKLDIDKLLPE
ncbi:MAG: hypothetical protein L3J39_04910 [Verrucomicrobiales bacterium]|nr:hypothetical protein [Verrucomicrobiales bacterium]